MSFANFNGRAFDPDVPPLGDLRAAAAERASAEVGSSALRRAIERSGLAANDAAPVQRSFDEQMALVASGRARLVPAWHQHRPDPEFTLAGVSAGVLADSNPGA